MGCKWRGAQPLAMVPIKLASGASKKGRVCGDCLGTDLRSRWETKTRRRAWRTRRAWKAVDLKRLGMSQRHKLPKVHSSKVVSCQRVQVTKGARYQGSRTSRMRGPRGTNDEGCMFQAVSLRQAMSDPHGSVYDLLSQDKYGLSKPGYDFEGLTVAKALGPKADQVRKSIGPSSGLHWRSNLDSIRMVLVKPRNREGSVDACSRWNNVGKGSRQNGLTLGKGLARGLDSGTQFEPSTVGGLLEHAWRSGPPRVG
ncbi:hypothetical protein Bca52824_094910 [Brassica carinata]|uniref:Uncharacterized protein n=1 Tax=Brassica carinata TaxID=52824 RepID=A0A8X7P2P9_BRACI|nr:hypothetical protein Bca52824_094910 [Brassica carinata]